MRYPKLYLPNIHDMNTEIHVLMRKSLENEKRQLWRNYREVLVKLGSLQNKIRLTHRILIDRHKGNEGGKTSREY